MSFVKWLTAGARSGYHQAIAHYNARRFEEAAAAFRAVLAHAPDRHDPWTSLSRFYLAESHCQLAWEAVRENALARARDHFVAAAEAGYRYPDLHLRLGRVLEDLGEREEAMAAYGEALALNPTLLEALARRTALLLESGKDAPDDLQALDAAGFPLPTTWRGGSGERGGRAAAAGDVRTHREALLTAIRAELARRESVSDRVREALHAFDTEDAETALLQLEAAVELRPDYPDLHFRIGVLHARAGRSSAARTSFLTALRLNPDYEDARLWLSRLDVSRAA